jgi:RNA polymerase sigma-70 factor, ECF subfamily
VPPPERRGERLVSVLAVVYLIFNEGHLATTGDEWVRPEMCLEALRLGRMLAELMPAEPEVHGLVALMEIQASRLAARVDPDGQPVPLLEQNRGRWDQLLIRRGFAALLRARQLGRPAGPYVLQAAIAACHARARTATDTDWAAIRALYSTLATVAPSPVVTLNHAVAVAMVDGPDAGLRIVDELAAQPLLATYHLLPVVRGDLLARVGRTEEARRELRRAADLATNTGERALLRARAEAL